MLVTAFEPFGGEQINPAAQAVAALPERIGAVTLTRLVVPTVFGACVEQVTARLAAERFDAVLCVGQAGGRDAVTPERVAINVDDARIPDNAGQQPLDRSIVPGGPAAYFTTLPNKAIVQAIRAAGVPSTLSNTAGTYVCNHLIYGVLHHLATHDPAVRAGFIHVPYVPEQVAERPGTLALPLPDLVAALTAAVSAIASHDGDVELPEGALH